MVYKSSRGESEKISSGEAILKGIAGDGGLFVPDHIPRIDINRELFNMNYNELATHILKQFLTDFSENEIETCVKKAYDEKFSDKRIAPLTSISGFNFLELFHGPTLAFKDFALTLLPHLMKVAAEKNGITKKICILVSTSGDTGKAALEAFASVSGTLICAVFPHKKVSLIQELQMTTQEGENVLVLSLLGNFDDCQTALKKVLNDQAIAKKMDELGVMFSVANSINIGRLLPQIVYYFYAYGQMLKNGAINLDDKINFTVPTGNFGNILAGYYAKEMGLPIKNLICASNSNDVLFEFLNSGHYSVNREFFTTISPSMDILISSNLERLIYHLSSPEKTSALMKQLSDNGSYNFDIKNKGFFGEFTSEAETLQAISTMQKNKYTMDTHTAVAFSAYEKYAKKSGDKTPNIIISTASPFKFSNNVLDGINFSNGEVFKSIDPFEAVSELSNKSGLKPPRNILNLKEKPVLHEKCCTKENYPDFISTFVTKSLQM